jgi:hypothetical protein
MTTSLFQLLLALINLGMLILMLVLILYIWRQRAQRQRQQASLLKRHAAQLQDGAWFRIRYASATHFKKWGKILPWQHTGILQVLPNGLRLYLSNDNIVELPATQTQAAWLGQQFWPNGALCWLSLSHHDSEHYVTAETGATLLRSQTKTRAIFEQLMQFTHGLTLDQQRHRPPVSAFAIEKHRSTLLFVILFFMLTAYFLIDHFFVLQEQYISRPYHAIFVIGGLLALLPSYLLMERAQVPRTEKTVIALLFCLATVGALYPGLRRINQLTDTQGLHVYNYVFSETRLLLPDDKALPRLALASNPHHKAYWLQFKPGDRYAIALRKGGLGFYQINMSPIMENIQLFYTRQAKENLGSIE